MTKREQKLIDLWIINTELTPGCRVLIKTEWYSEYTIIDEEWVYLVNDNLYTISSYDYDQRYDRYEILWHKLYLGELIQKIVDKRQYKPNTHLFDMGISTILQILSERLCNFSLPFHELPDQNKENIYNLLFSIFSTW